MNRALRRLRRVASPLAAAALVVTVAACGGGDETDDSSTTGTSAPDSITESGVIRNGVAYSYPPMAFLLDGEMAGVDHELAIELGRAMGVETETLDAGSTSAVLPGLQSGRYDMNVGSQGITAERLATFDMVSYLDLAYNFLVKAGNPAGVTPEGCGARIGQSLGSAFIEIVEGLSESCQEAGLPEIDLQTFQDSGAIRVAIETDRIDGTIGQVTGNVYNAQEGGFETVGEPTVFGVNGIVVNKGDTELAEAIREALTTLIEDGTYQEILDSHGVGDVALDGQPEIFTEPADLEGVQ